MGELVLFLIEIVVEIVFAAGATEADRRYHDDSDHRTTRLLLFALAGALSGFATLFILPTPQLSSPDARLAWLFFAPAMGAGVMGGLNAFHRRNDPRPWQVWPFVLGATFVGTMALVRHFLLIGASSAS